MLKKALLCLCTTVFTIWAYAQQADSLWQAISTAPDSRKHELYIQLSNTYINANPLKAIETATQALEFPHNATQDASARQLIGNLYFRTGNLNKSIEYFQKSILAAGESGNDRQKALSQSSLGGVYFMNGNLSEAASNYLQALRYFETQQDKNSMVNVYAGLANIYTKQNNFSKALEYNLKAISIYEASSNTFKKLLSYEQIGNLYLKQNNYTKANEYFLQSLNLYKELNNMAGEASTRFQLGNIGAALHQNNQAIQQYQISLALSKRLNMLPLQAANYNALAKTYEEQGEFEQAIQQAKQAQRIAQNSNLKIELEMAYETLSRLYKVTEKPQQAKTFESLSKNIKDSLYNDSTLKQLADLQLRYESEKSKQQLLLQEKEQTILSSELLREKQKQNMFLSLLSVLIIGFTVVGYLFIRNQKQTKRLKEQKEELGQLNQVKDRFFSIISHDLRNNLTTMKLYFDLISNPDYKPDEDAKEFSKQISSSVENTIDLLENLLVWAQAQIKGIDVKPQTLDVHALVVDNIALLGGSAHQKGIELINETSSFTIWADEDMMNLVIRNLISNAIKFTQHGGKVTVRAYQAEGKINIEVIDTGVGISSEVLEHLFTKNANPSTLGTANEKGTGLGLLLCKEFVEKNNGNISVTSVPTKGSTFTIQLPVVH